jgi:hypothetical protein
MKQAKGNMQVIEEHRRAIDIKYGDGTFNDIYLSFKKRTTLSAHWLEERIRDWSKRLTHEKRKKHLQ